MSILHAVEAAPGAAGAPGRASLRAGLSILVMALCLALAADRAAEIDWAHVRAILAGYEIGALMAALALVALSHLAIAAYDLPAQALLRRHTPWTRALAGGFAGSVFSQTLGLGVVTGTAARTRIYRANGFGPGAALAMTGVVAAGFLGGAAALIAALSLAAPAALAGLWGASPDAVRLAAFALLLLVAVAALSRRRGASPGVRRVAAAGVVFASLAAVDLVAAGLAFRILLPDGAAPEALTFLALFAAALSLGLLIGAPMALGPFEAVMFAVLGQVPAAELAAAILAFRALYFIPSFLIAAAMVAAARRAPATALVDGEALRERIEWRLAVDARAEGELARLGDKRIYMEAEGDGFIMFGVHGRIWLALGDPVGPRRRWDALAAGLEAEARAAGARLAVYKATEAGFWAARGYRLIPLGEEATVDPRAFTTAGPARRSLRRKIRQAEKAGATLRFHEPTEAPLAALAPVAEAWRQMKGGRENGFSTGRWSPGFARRHTILSAWVAEQPVAFITLWRSADGREWALDLMRYGPEAPAGAVHALIVEALRRAAETGVARFNLCMAPLSGPAAAGSGLRERLRRRLFAAVGARFGMAGLRRFKEGFDPDWAPRFLAARTTIDGAEALLAAAMLVRGDGPAKPAGRCPLASAPDAPPARASKTETETETARRAA